MTTKEQWARRIAKRHCVIERGPQVSAFAFWALGFCTATVCAGVLFSALAYHFTLTPRDSAAQWRVLR